MDTDTNDTDNANGSNSTDNATLAETVGIARSALDRLGNALDDRDCRGAVDATGYYVLEDPDNEDAWVRTQDLEEVRC